MNPWAKLKTHDCTNGLKRWRWPMFWTTFHVKRLSTCQKSSWSHPFKLTFDSARSSQWSWHFKNVPQDFDWKFGYVACCSQICTTSADWSANTEVSQSQSKPFWPCKQWQKLFKNITEGDPHVFSVTMLKQNPSLHNRSQKRHPDPNKHGKFGEMWKWCWLFLCFEGAVHHEFSTDGQTVDKEY